MTTIQRIIASKESLKAFYDGVIDRQAAHQYLKGSTPTLNTIKKLLLHERITPVEAVELAEEKMKSINSRFWSTKYRRFIDMVKSIYSIL